MIDREPHDDNLARRVAHSFAEMDVPAPPSAAETLASLQARQITAVVAGWPGPSPSRPFRLRLVWGAAGIAAAMAILTFLVVSQSVPLSAMERMAEHLRQVTSYQYHISSTTTQRTREGEHATTWNEEGNVYWRAPNAFRFEDKIIKRTKPTTADRPGDELLEHFVEVVPADNTGVLIDHRRKTFLREEAASPEIKTYPWQPLKMIREGKGKIVRELGNGLIDGKSARGYVTRFESGDPPRSHEWHVWVDPATDLPLEFGYTESDDEEPRTTTVLRVSGFRWNEELDSALFDATPPVDYRQTSSLPEPNGE